MTHHLILRINIFNRVEGISIPPDKTTAMKRLGVKSAASNESP